MAGDIRWKIVNPYSFIREFDKWFDFERERTKHPDGWIPNNVMHRFFNTGRVWESR